MDKCRKREKVRVDKYLAESSVGTRKKVRSYIIDGYVAINGKNIKDPSMEVDASDLITYLGQPVAYEGKVYYMFHKPAGCVTARKDSKDMTVLDYFGDVSTGGIFPVGRLDKDTEGLLFLTNDGEFDHRLMSPQNHIEKKYFFWATGVISDEDITRLEAGISIGDGDSITKPSKIEIIKAGSYREFANEMDINYTINMKEKVYEQQVFCGYITISEGRKHQVKRMIRAVGCKVVYLKRVSIGLVSLDANLKKGEYRLLTEQEIQQQMSR